MKRLFALIGLLGFLTVSVQAEEKAATVYVAGMTGVT